MGNEFINVLDKGYVRAVQPFGSDLTVVNAARVSYSKQSDELNESDHKLIKFLAKNDHTSPFRHCGIQFEVYAPLMVARQWWKYVVGSDHIMDAWNESSRRYVTETPEFYIPLETEWRSAPENKKQGSGGAYYLEDPSGAVKATGALKDYVQQGVKAYEKALELGICAEQARLFLPAYGLYVRWYWTASLQSIAHFINQRIEHDAQKEIQLYAQAVYTHAQNLFPISVKALVEK